jgi:hypothetical protein
MGIGGVGIGQVQIKIMQSYVDTIILIANGLRSKEDFFPIGICYPPGMKDYGMKDRLRRAFGCVGIRFSWDTERKIVWVYETVERSQQRKEGVLQLNAKVKTE